MTALKSPRFYRITYDLPDEQYRVTYVRADNEDHARTKVFDRYRDEGIEPEIRSVQKAEGEFITEGA